MAARAEGAFACCSLNCSLPYLYCDCSCFTGTQDAALLAYQIGFELVDCELQSFLAKVKTRLDALVPAAPAASPPAAAPAAGAEAAGGAEAMDAEGAAVAAPAAPAVAAPAVEESEADKGAPAAGVCLREGQGEAVRLGRDCSHYEGSSAGRVQRCWRSALAAALHPRGRWQPPLSPTHQYAHSFDGLRTSGTCYQPLGCRALHALLACCCQRWAHQTGVAVDSALDSLQLASTPAAELRARYMRFQSVICARLCS